MTETLKHVLNQRADAVAFDAPDLSAIRADGDRTLRRRRAGVLGGGLLAAGVAVASAVVVTSGPAARDGAVATDPGSVGSTAVVSWVEGSTLHRSSGDEIDLGREAVAFVRTTEGYVFADAEGVVRAVTSPGPGGVTEVGRTQPDAVRLVSDPQGTRAAWVDADGSGIEVHDQATGAGLTLLDRFTDAEPALTAMDGDTVYVAVGDEARSLDLSTGEVSLVAADGSEVLSAADDLLVLGNDDGMRLLHPDRSTTVLRDDYGDIGTLSPDGAWFSSDADEPRVVSTATGERPTFDVPGFFATGYEWLDATTVAMITQESATAPVRLLTCRVPSGACEQAAELGTFEELFDQGFVLPVGMPTDD